MELRSATCAVTLGPDSAAIDLDELAGDVQPEAGAANGRPVGQIDALKTREKPVQVFGRNPQTFIFDADFDVRDRALYRDDPDVAATR